MGNRPTYDELEQLLADRTGKLAKATTHLIKVENDHSYREEVMRIQRDLSIELSTIYDLSEGLQLSLEAGLQVSGMDCGGIHLFDKASGDLLLQVHHGLADELVQEIAHLDKDSENARYARRGKPTYTERKNIDIAMSTTSHREGVLAFLSIPLLERGNVIGCMNLGSHRDTRVPLEVRIPIETIAAQIGSTVSLIKARAELRESEEHLKTLMEGASGFAVYRLIRDDNTPYTLKQAAISPSIEEILGYRPEDFQVFSYYDHIHPDDVEGVMEAHEAALETGKYDKIARIYNPKFGAYVWIHAVSVAVRDKNGEISHVNGIFLDVTEKYRAFQKLKDSEKELEDKTKNLLEMNAALNALIKNMESKESDFQEQVMANIQHLVLPYLEKIRTAAPDRIRTSLIDIVETNLKKISADFSHRLSSSLYNLTSTEIKVANLVKLGNTTKEIAITLGISYKTVESHRERIRKKLGINNKKINLRSHLLSM